MDSKTRETLMIIGVITLLLFFWWVGLHTGMKDIKWINDLDNSAY